MKTIAISLLAAALVAVAVMSSAQAATSSHHASAGTPSPWSILRRAAKAQTHAGSAHGVGSSTLTQAVRSGKSVKTVTDVGIFAGDASTHNPSRSRIQETLMTKTATSTKGGVLFYVTVAKHMADRANKTKQWTCRNISFLNKIDVWTPASFAFNPGKKTGHYSITGTPTLAGNSYWLIQQKYSQEKGKTHISSVATYAINRRTYTVRQMTEESVASQANRVSTERNSLTMTNFGEKLNISLPKCS